VNIKRLELNSLLLQYETQVLAIYDLERADPSADDFLDIDLDASIAKRRAEASRLRHQILSYAEA
jgi:hypothetical protein